MIKKRWGMRLANGIHGAGYTAASWYALVCFWSSCHAVLTLCVLSRTLRPISRSNCLPASSPIRSSFLISIFLPHRLDQQCVHCLRSVCVPPPAGGRKHSKGQDDGRGLSLSPGVAVARLILLGLLPPLPPPLIGSQQ